MFKPHFTLTPQLLNSLLRLEGLKTEIAGLPVTSHMLASLRETARYKSIHYSTQIEGNRLTQEEVVEVLKKGERFPGKERDEKELLGYDRALDEVEKLADEDAKLTEQIVKKIHALVMGGGKKNIKPTPYRDGQNVIRDGITHAIVYLPPEAKDVPKLMRDFVSWVSDAEKISELPPPLIAGIVHYQFATIHPYYDGNGRTARLLTTFILRKSDYGLNGIYSLEEYYAKDLASYYHALDRGPSHNYYLGRETADITPWLDYFCKGLIISFEAGKKQALAARDRGAVDKSSKLKRLNVRQRKMLALFTKKDTITSQDVAALFHMNPRTARALCKQWVDNYFLVIANESKKSRTYRLASRFAKLIADSGV